MPPSDRTAEIRRRVAAGERQADIARSMGISKQRVHQLLNRAEPTRPRVRRPASRARPEPMEAPATLAALAAPAGVLSWQIIALRALELADHLASEREQQVTASPAPRVDAPDRAALRTARARAERHRVRIAALREELAAARRAHKADRVAAVAVLRQYRIVTALAQEVGRQQGRQEGAVEAASALLVPMLRQQLHDALAIINDTPTP